MKYLFTSPKIYTELFNSNPQPSGSYQTVLTPDWIDNSNQEVFNETIRQIAKANNM